MKFNVTVKMVTSAIRKSIALKTFKAELSKIPLGVKQFRVEEYRSLKQAFDRAFKLSPKHSLYHATVNMSVEADTEDHAKQIVYTDKTLFAEVLASDTTIAVSESSATYIDALRITAAHKLKLN